jgi:hypothetical protein
LEYPRPEGLLNVQVKSIEPELIYKSSQYFGTGELSVTVGANNLMAIQLPLPFLQVHLTVELPADPRLCDPDVAGEIHEVGLLPSLQ